jgi:hypothetical protein
MNANNTNQRVPTRFRPEVRFQLVPRGRTFSGNSVQGQFEQLKARLLRPVLDNAEDIAVRRQLRLAANEAAAVAWTTAFPLLVLPVLLDEKAEEVRRYTRRQELIQEASPLLAETTV